MLVGEVYDEGVPGGAQHWVDFADYASDQPITLQRSGAAYPGLGAFLNATRGAESRYVALSLTRLLGAVPAGAGATTAETGLRGLVQAWVDGTRPNHGLFLSRDEGEDSVVLASRESPDARVRPRLEVCTLSCEQTCATPCGRDEVCAGGACVQPDDTATCHGEAPPAEDCSRNGLFMQGRCFCDPGFTGDRCEVSSAACPNDCSGAGVCMHGRCFCAPGYGGEACTPL